MSKKHEEVRFKLLKAEDYPKIQAKANKEGLSVSNFCKKVVYIEINKE